MIISQSKKNINVLFLYVYILLGYMSSRVNKYISLLTLYFVPLELYGSI